MSDQPTIIVDIDGTIADCEHRLHHITGFQDDIEATKKADWDAFYADVHLDKPIEPTCHLVRCLSEAGWGVILITGRSYSAREKTTNWLSVHNIPYDMLLMRKTGDHTNDDELKKQWLYDLREGRIHMPKFEVPTIVLEDRKRVVDMWRKEGLVCLQVAEGDF